MLSSGTVESEGDDERWKDEKKKEKSKRMNCLRLRVSKRMRMMTSTMKKKVGTEMGVGWLGE